MNRRAGRILVLRVEADALELVSEKEVRGAVYNLNAFKGKLLAGINSKLELFKWTPREDDAHELVSECSHHGQIITLSVKTRGDLDPRRRFDEVHVAVAVQARRRRDRRDRERLQRELDDCGGDVRR